MQYYVMAALLSAGTIFNASFDKANTAYEQGDYPTAIAVYEQLILEGVYEAPVFFNLGNAYYRTGNVGAAIANFERALQVDPAFEPARTSLEFAVAKTEHQSAKPLPPAWEQSLLIWHFSWSPRAVYRSAVLCWLAFWSVLAIRLWKPNKQLTRLAIVLGLAASAFAASAYVKAHPGILAVAIADHTPVRFGPAESKATSFELSKGDRVAVDQRRDGWAQVRTADGARGWAEDSALAYVGPPYIRPASETPKEKTNRDAQ